MENERANDAETTKQFLSECLKIMPTLPQLRLTLNESKYKVDSLDEENIVKKSKSDILTCDYCYSNIDITRADIKEVKTKKNRVLKVKCHLCKKIVSEQRFNFVKVEEVSPVVETAPKQEEIVVIKKKKKSKSDKTAGLIIPPALSKKHISHPKSQMKNTSKLKSLLNSSDGPSKSNLMDFLNKMK